MNAAKSCTATFTLQQTSIVPDISAPSSVGFSTTVIGRSSTKSITISNKGKGVLTVTKVDVTGTNAAMFKPLSTFFIVSTFILILSQSQLLADFQRKQDCDTADLLKRSGLTDKEHCSQRLRQQQRRRLKTPFRDTCRGSLGSPFFVKQHSRDMFVVVNFGTIRSPWRRWNYENNLNRRNVTNAPIRLPRTTSHTVCALVTTLL